MDSAQPPATNEYATPATEPLGIPPPTTATSPGINEDQNENMINGTAAAVAVVAASPPSFILAPGGERAIAQQQQRQGTHAKIVMDYTTDFPELAPAPNGNVGAGNHPGSTPAWGKPPPKIVSSTATQVFHLPPEERAMLDNNNKFGSTNTEQDRCNDIAQKTGTTIVLSESRDKTLTVMMTGLRQNVEEARKLAVQQLQYQARKYIRIPKEHHRTIIGRNGERLNELQALSNCRIIIPGREVNSEEIEVMGPREGIDQALHELQQISDEQSKKAQEHLLIPRIFYPWIRGADDETLLRIQSETGARVNIPPPMATGEVINVTGEKEGVYKAAAMIKAIYEEKQRTAKSVTCKVAKAQHRYVIGPGRHGLTDVLRATGVSVEIPPEDVDSDTVTLRGDAEKLGEALSLVYAKASSVITTEIPCPDWLHRHIIGPKGSGLHALGLQGAECKVHVTFDDEKGAIYLEGPPEAVKSAHEKLSSKAIDLQAEMSFQNVRVHPNYHRHIIGKQGALIGKIKQETGVSITVPDEATNSDQIRIEGKKEGVAKAANEILEIARRLENEKSRDILIESRFHRQLIGAKGESVQKIRAMFPNCVLSFPEPGRKSDVVNLRGPKEELDKCYKHLQATLKELLENNFQMQVPIFKEFHRNIIGKGGVTIRKIREETSTRIDLPAEGSDDSTITVVGKKANVEKAVAQLTRIQNELANIETQEVKIAPKIQPRLRYGGNRLIKDIQDECGGVQIRFPPEKSNSDKVTIRGPKEDVAKAAQLLTDLAKDREVSSFEDSVTAKPELHRFLIGKGGGKIRKLRESFPDVRVLFPREQDAEQETIHLIGREEEVAKVKKQLQELVAELNEITEIDVDVATKWHRHFVLRGAAVIREVQDSNGAVIISFPKAATNSTRVLIKGAKDCCESAKKRIEEIVQDLEASVTITVSIPQEYHRTLLMNRGAKVQDIEQQHNVNIRFPDSRNAPPRLSNGFGSVPASPETPTEVGAAGDAPESPAVDTSAVIVSGRPENCELAKEKLLALVPVREYLAVPFEFHGGLIGKRGEGVRKLMDDFDVRINIPPAQQKKNEIEIVGVADCVKEASAEVLKMVEDWEARQYQTTLEVPVEFHSRLIGPGFRALNELRTKYDVQILMPKPDSLSTTVTVIGLESQCAECCAEIERLVAEVQSRFTQEITIDGRVHARIIGQKRRNIKKIEEDFSCEVEFPRRNDPNPNLVTVSGKDADMVYDCVDHLRNIEEDFLQDVVDRHSYQREAEPTKYHHPIAQQQMEMTNAPWNAAMPDLTNKQEFPSMGPMGDVENTNGAASSPMMGAWGARRS